MILNLKWCSIQLYESAGRLWCVMLSCLQSCPHLCLVVQRYEKTIRTSEVLRKKCGIRGKIDFRHVKSAWNVDFCHDYAAVLFKNNASFSLKQCSSSIKNNAVFVVKYISVIKTRMPPKLLRRHTVYSWNDKQKKSRIFVKMMPNYKSQPTADRKSVV